LYLTGNTVCPCYKDQPVNAVYGDLLGESYGTHKYIVLAIFGGVNVEASGYH
jgi:hypothetical protein